MKYLSIARRSFSAVALFAVATLSPLTSSAQSKVEELFIEGTKTDTTLTIDVQMGPSCRQTLKVQEGAMNILQREDEAPIRFIVQRATPASSDFQLLPIELTERMYKGRKVPMLKVLPAATWGATTTASLQSKGVSAMNITAVQPRVKRATTSLTPVAALTTVCPEEPCLTPPKPMRCCYYVSCEGKRFKFCSSSDDDNTCGGDGCGECCL